MSGQALARGSLRLVGGGVPRVIHVAAIAFDVPADDLTGPSRRHPMVDYRHVTMAAARLLGHSYPVIAAAFDGRDHTTVVHACRRVALAPELERRARILADAVTNAPGELF